MPALPKETQGKLIDTWIYAYRGSTLPGGLSDDGEDVDQIVVADQKVEFKVYVVKEQKALQTPPHLTAGVKFRVECATPRVVREGTDLEIIRTEIFSLCDRHYETKWEKWYLVEVSSSPPYSGLGAGLTFQYRDVEKGVAWNGTVLLRDRDFNSRRYERTIKKWPGEFTDRGGNIVACIPGTKENEKSLQEFARRVEKLREAMAGLLQPEVIQATLSNLNGLTLLPGTEDPADLADAHDQREAVRDL